MIPALKKLIRKLKPDYSAHNARVKAEYEFALKIWRKYNYYSDISGPMLFENRSGKLWLYIPQNFKPTLTCAKRSDEWRTTNRKSTDW